MTTGHWVEGTWLKSIPDRDPAEALRQECADLWATEWKRDHLAFKCCKDALSRQAV